MINTDTYILQQRTLYIMRFHIFQQEYIFLNNIIKLNHNFKLYFLKKICPFRITNIWNMHNLAWFCRTVFTRNYTKQKRHIGVVLMLGHSLRRSPNAKPTSKQRYEQGR